MASDICASLWSAAATAHMKCLLFAHIHTLCLIVFAAVCGTVGVVILNTICLSWQKNGFCVQTHRRTPAATEAGTGPGITTELVISPGLTGKIPSACEPQTHKQCSNLLPTSVE